MTDDRLDEARQGRFGAVFTAEAVREALSSVDDDAARKVLTAPRWSFDQIANDCSKAFHLVWEPHILERERGGIREEEEGLREIADGARRLRAILQRKLKIDRETGEPEEIDGDSSYVTMQRIPQRLLHLEGVGKPLSDHGASPLDYVLNMADDLLWLQKALSKAADEAKSEMPKGRWETSAENQAKRDLAHCLAEIYSLAFDKKPSADAEARGAWPEFLKAVFSLVGIESTADNNRDIVKRVRRERNKGMVDFGRIFSDE